MGDSSSEGFMSATSQRAPSSQLPESIRIALESGVRDCARCGEIHEKLVWHKFMQPPVLSAGRSYRYWAMCPRTGDPILLEVGGEPVAGNKPRGEQADSDPVKAWLKWLEGLPEIVRNALWTE